MSYTVKLTAGATFTMCPPGVAVDAQMEPDCAHVGRMSGHEFGGWGHKDKATSPTDVRRFEDRKRRKKLERMQSFRMPSGKMFHPPEGL